VEPSSGLQVGVRLPSRSTGVKSFSPAFGFAQKVHTWSRGPSPFGRRWPEGPDEGSYSEDLSALTRPSATLSRWERAHSTIVIDFLCKTPALPLLEPGAFQNRVIYILTTTKNSRICLGTQATGHFFSRESRPRKLYQQPRIFSGELSEDSTLSRSRP
jgi:hypothetical protein